MCVCCGGLGSGLGSAQEGTTVRVSASPRKEARHLGSGERGGGLCLLMDRVLLLIGWKTGNGGPRGVQGGGEHGKRKEERGRMSKTGGLRLKKRERERSSNLIFF